VGETAADTKREIEEIRKDVSSAVSELNARVARALSPRTYLDFARENPAAIVGVGLGGVALAGALFARSVAESRRQRDPVVRLERNVRGAVEELGEGVQRAWSALPSLPIEVRVGARDGDTENLQAQRLTSSGKEPGMVKRILWAALVAVLMAAAGLAARRLSATIWRSAMGEAPPTQNV
jgi:hypothetical protein